MKKTSVAQKPDVLINLPNMPNFERKIWELSVDLLFTQFFRSGLDCHIYVIFWTENGYGAYSKEKNQRFSSDYLLVCHCICCQLLHSSQYWILILSVCSLGDKEESLSKHFGWFFKSTRPILVCFWFLVSSFNQN